MLDNLKTFINERLADATKHPEYALDYRGQAYGAIMFMFNYCDFTEVDKYEIVSFWDGAWDNFNEIYKDYVTGGKEN